MRLLGSPTFLSSTRTQILYIVPIGLDHWLRFRRDRFDQFAKTPNHSGVRVWIWVWIWVQVRFGNVVVLGLDRVFEEDGFEEIHYSQLFVPISYWCLGICLLFLCLVDKKNQLLGLCLLLLCLVDNEDLLLSLCLCYWSSLWFLDFNFVFLDLGLCSYCSCSRHT